MNSAVFYDWMEKKIFPKLMDKTVMLIDRASYHTRLTPESTPASASMNKVCRWQVTIRSNSTTGQSHMVTPLASLRMRSCSILAAVDAQSKNSLGFACK